MEYNINCLKVPNEETSMEKRSTAINTVAQSQAAQVQQSNFDDQQEDHPLENDILQGDDDISEFLAQQD